MKQHIPRIFIELPLKINKIIILSISESHYIIHVLRMNINDIVEIFNNTNYIFLSKIFNIHKKIVTILIFQKEYKNIESTLDINLGQVISKNEKMDFTIQKSIELGVNIITPLFSEKCNLKKNFKRISQKMIHWKKIAIAACQQCKRNIVPKIEEPISLDSWCKKDQVNVTKIVFHPKSILTIQNLTKSIKKIHILIGSEKGFSENEIEKITNDGFISLSLGPRILRTETASITAISILQYRLGDLK